MPWLSGRCSTLMRPWNPVAWRATRRSSGTGSPPSLISSRCQSWWVCDSTLASARASSTGRSRVRIRIATRTPLGAPASVRLARLFG